MRILIISQYYDPEPVYIPATVARGLAELGHSVTVVTGFPNYPAGKLYAGFSQRFRRKDEDGTVTVIRTPLWISHSENAMGRFMNYFSFAFSSLVACFTVQSPDVVYVYGAQMTANLGPSMRRLIFRTPYVVHIQDLWPESVTGSSMVRGSRNVRLINALLNPLLTFVYRQATAVVAIAPTMARMLVDRGVPPGNIRTVYNWANEGVGEEAASTADRHGSHVRASTEVLVVYAGNLGDHQDLETVVRAAKAVESEGSLRFEIYGAGMARERLSALAADLEVRNLTFHGSVDASRMREVYERADYQLVTLKDSEIFRGTIPSKLQACLHHGSAVLTNVAGDVAEICSREAFGFTCEPESVESMADMFRRAANTSPEARQTMAKNGHNFYHANMSFSEGIKALEQILGEAAIRKGM